MAASLVQLRRLRSAGIRAGSTPEFDDVRRIVDTTADVRYLPGLSQPVTFGAWRPVVLLPQALQSHPPEIQRAVLCHELLHVQRRDWLWLLAEEIVRAALWFHPGVWWLVSRVQLTREEVVDELAVLATGRRRTYIEALMAFADDTPLAPAAAFARRRHLFRRMVLLSKEAGMSSRRVVMSCAVLMVSVGAGSRVAVDAFPLRASDAFVQQLGSDPGPLEKAAKPITPENPVPRRVNSADAAVPQALTSAGATGSVTMRMTLDELGRVAELRPVAVSFVSPSQQISARFGRSATESLNSLLAKARTLHGAEGERVARESIQAMAASADQALRQWRYDPPAAAPMAFDVSVNFLPGGESDATQHAGAGTIPTGGSARVSGVSSAGGPAPLRVGGNIKAPVKTKDVRPVYPEDAKAARVQGVVILEVLVDGEGAVSEARVLRSIPMLDQAAHDAVTQWRFTPTLLNGQPVPVMMTVTVNFTLQP
jgi:TonB family protein